MTREKLVNIFYSNYQAGADIELIDEILFLINEKCINHESKVISDKKDFDLFIDKMDCGEIKTSDIVGGGKGHLALKLIAIKYFGHPGSKINCENWFQGYIPDLMFKDGENITIIECGDTNPEKIFEYFIRKEVVKIIIIPYSSDEGLIFQHIFTKGPDFYEYLQMKNDMTMKKVKKIIQKMK